MKIITKQQVDNSTIPEYEKLLNDYHPNVKSPFTTEEKSPLLASGDAQFPEFSHLFGGDGVCADNVDYGLSLNQMFLDEEIKGKRHPSELHKLMRLHNHEVGRLVSQNIPYS